MRRIILSLVTIAGIVALGIGASQAWFSDTETSTGNVFQAGAIDLLIDNESYVTNEAGVLVASPATSWSLDDLTGHLFFNFFDVKPGDIGEDTISVHVNDNDAYLCAAAQVTEDSDVDYTEPELADDTTQNPNDLFGGELGEQLNFAFWADDGDNVYETGEQIFVQGPASNLNTLGKIALADNSVNRWLGGTGPIVGGQTYYIGKAWCFGTLTPVGLTPGNGGPLDNNRGTGFTCDGVVINNAAQTDRVMGDIEFFAVQSRNNPNFSCESNYSPSFPTAENSIKVGAALASYEAPQICDVTVNGGTIAAGIASAVEGNTVCVADGTYTENVTINKDVTLASLNGPTATAKIEGRVDITADGATLTGFEINPAVNVDNAVFVGNSNVEVSYNYIHDVDNVNTVKGIHVHKGSAPALTNITIMHNKIDDVVTVDKGVYGIMIQGPLDGVVANYNTVTNLEVTGAGWSGQGIEVTPTGSSSIPPQNVTIMYNHIATIDTGSQPGKAITIDWADSGPYFAEASEVIVRFNNFVGAALGIRNLDSDTLYAPNNWFDVTTDVQGDVNYLPEATGPYDQN